MSTEKSLLTFQDVTYPKIDHGKEYDGLHFPIGVSPTGTFEVANLSHSDGASHICLLGVTGSGKTKYVEFVLKALHEMYGSDIAFFYLDGKGCEYPYWKKQAHMLFKSVSNCSTVESLTQTLYDVIDYVESKLNREPALIVIDDASTLVDINSSVLKPLLHYLYIEGSRKNVHVLWASQIYCGKLTDVCTEFGLVCATRVREEDSVELFGSKVACRDAGVRRYGDIVYSYKGFTSKVRVPFCKD